MTLVVWQVWRTLRAVGCQGRKIAGCKTLGVPGLVLAHWWEELGSGMSDHRAGVPRSNAGLLAGGVDFWSGRLRSAKYLAAGGWSSGPKLPLAHLGVDAGSWGSQGWCQPTGGYLLEFIIKITFYFFSKEI